ncbi:MAG: aminoacyl-tRNA hydrolase [Aestuariivirgaceae bacterium]|jgi:PTH1 family peptidyl-tRNA hydrolase
MLLLVGLGNPGLKYAANRHNIGFVTIDAIARRHGFGAWRRKFQSEVAEGSLGGAKVLALKPQTYMNDSGRAVGEAARFFQIAPDSVVVLHDELDLPLGKLRAKAGGGHAGHNGLRSIEAHVGPGFHRIRLGIGHPGEKALVHHYVLDDFSKAELALAEDLVHAVAVEADLIGARDFTTLQNRVHLALNPAPPRGDAAPGEVPATGKGRQ